MFKDKFNMILEKDEEIKWCNGINTSAYVKKNFFKTFLFGLFPPFAMLMLGVPYTLILLTLSLLEIIPLWIGVAHFIFSFIACLTFVSILSKNAKNTFLCITSERVIKRSGAFNNKFINYPLRNLGTIEVVGGLFDGNGENPSANLLISVKDYHTNTDGNSHPRKLEVVSLNNAYEAYKLLNELTKGNNEVLRVNVE